MTHSELLAQNEELRQQLQWKQNLLDSITAQFTNRGYVPVAFETETLPSHVGAVLGELENARERLNELENEAEPVDATVQLLRAARDDLVIENRIFQAACRTLIDEADTIKAERNDLWSERDEARTELAEARLQLEESRKSEPSA